MRVVALIFCVLLGLAGSVCGAEWPESHLFAGRDEASVAGSSACRECHVDFHERWEQSRHGASVRGVNLGWVEEVFGKLPIQFGGAVLEAEGGDVWMCIGGRERLRVMSALGGRDVWYFLAEWGDPVRLQVLPMAYDLRRGEWFSPGAEVGGLHGGGVGVEWTSETLTFSGGCYSCHVSGGGSGRLAGGGWWEEPGIRCESCHGAGGEHVRVCREVGEGAVPEDLKIIAAGGFTSGQLDGLCGSCHGRLGVISAGFRPGDLFADHFDLALWEDANFGPGGSEVGETYTMTSWQANPCAREGGLSCLDCHTSSGRDRFPGAEANRACMPCHAERVERVEEHSRHVSGQPGGRCVDCHMPVSEFGRMRRHDHSFRAPAPAVHVEFGGRSACGICHLDEGEAWALGKVREWHGERAGEGELRRARMLELARAGVWARLDEMLGSLVSEAGFPVYVASMARLLAGCEDEAVAGALVGLLGHESLWVRASAADAMVGRLVPAAVTGLLRLAGDPVRLVRLRAASALAPLPGGILEGEDGEVVQRAWVELEAMLLERSGEVGGMEALGHFYLDRGREAEAGRWLVRALGEQPENLGLMVSAGSALFRAGDLEGARTWFERAVRLHPSSGMAWANWVKYLMAVGSEVEAARARREAELSLEGDQLEGYRGRVQ